MAGMTRAAEHERALQGGAITDLFAEDLVRGYRIDVRQFPRDRAPAGDPPPWMSLHRRRGSLDITPPGGADRRSIRVEDEGFVQPAVFQDPEDPEVPDAVRALRIHESIFHWQGFSLSVPPPMDAIDLGADGMAIGPPASAGLPRLTSSFNVEPQSLPRLRFGHTYQVRARVVDLAGNGPTSSDADNALAALAASDTRLPLLPFDPDDQAEAVYRRFESVPAPVIVPCEDLTDGEALNVMVIRSDGGTTAEYAESLGDPRFHGINERHIVPPKASHSFIETHGVLEQAFGTSGDPGALVHTLKRNGGTLNDGFVHSLDTGERTFFPDITMNTGTSSERRFEHGIRFVATGPAGPRAPAHATNGYTVHYEQQLLLPYLPDPLARGASLFNLPGLVTQTVRLQESPTPDGTGTLVFSNSDGQVLPQKAIDQLGLVTKIGFPVKGRWPELQPFRLRLDGTAADTPFAPPAWSEIGGARVLTVRLPPGTSRTVWLSTYVDEPDLPLMGLHWWWRLRGEVEGPKHFRAMARHGALAMLTPARQLTLVHATPRPVIAPTEDPAARFGADRMLPNSTAAYIGGRFKLHGPSTAKVDVIATWKELGEGPGGSQIRTSTEHVLEQSIDPDGRPETVEHDPVPIADTRKHFEEHMLELTFLSPKRREEAESRQWLARHEFSDTRYRKITYSVVATTRYREFFPRRILDRADSLTRTTRFADVIVRSSARPPVPAITAVLPSFGWSELVDGLRLMKSTRTGGGLRVYLGATWNASGDDERLAVIEARAGADPIHLRPASGGLGDVRPDATEVTASSPEGTFRVFPYAVQYDAEIGQWYSDITFAVAGAYFPFIRLTLARYQEHSLPGLQLSATVHAGFHQLAPNRSISFDYLDVPMRPDLQRIVIRVNGDGASAATLPAASRNIDYRVEVGVEQRDAIFPDAEMGWTEASASEQPVRDAATPVAGVLWSGEVIVARNTGSKRRIVVREFELFPRNQRHPGLDWTTEAGAEHARRLVYLDTILL